MARIYLGDKGHHWPIPLMPSMRHRTLICVCLCLLTIAAFGSVRLIAEANGPMERRGLAKRQFHLAGFLAQAQQQETQMASFPTETVASSPPNAPWPAHDDSSASSVGEASSVTTSWMSATTRLDDVTETNAPPDAMQLLFKALTNALGESIKAPEGLAGRSPPPSSTSVISNESQALRGVLDLGVIVINIITSTMRATTTLNPGIVAVLDDVTALVYSAADRLQEPLCAISHVVQGIPLDAVLPCSSAEKGPLSVNIVTLNPTATAMPPRDGSVSWQAIPLETYGPVPPPSTILPPNSDYPQQPPNVGPSSYGTQDAYQQPTGTSPTSCPVQQPLPCPTCPSCDDCPCKQCATTEGCKGQETALPNGGSSCPGRGFECADCPDGWFCPPQETPAQSVPCGLGWPCFHCNSGWFCTSQNTGAPAPTAAPNPEPNPAPDTPLPAPATSTPATSTVAAPSSGPNGGVESVPRPSESGPDEKADDWSYLGCFQDAMDRTLVGASQQDALRGDMSKSTCLEHCSSQGYPFAGTEYGQECWCGRSIRQGAVQLAEDACNMTCQGDQEATLCGGEWAVSVYMCQARLGTDSGPIAGPMGGTAGAVPGADETDQSHPQPYFSE